LDKTTSQNKFILKALEKFGNTYNYSLVKYANARTKVIIICEKHGKFEQTPDQHLRGSGCPQCSRLRQAEKNTLTETEVRERLCKKGYKLKSSYQGSRVPIDLECSLGHRWSAIPANVLNRNGGCPDCAIHKRGESQKLSMRQLDSVLSSKGIKLIGEYINSHTRTEFECKNGHRWQTSYHSIQGGNGCPYCSRKIQYTFESAYRKLEDKGIKLLTHISKATDYAELECIKGHRWRAVVSSVVNRTGCPECYRQSAGENQKLTLDEVNSTLYARGFSMNGDYKNVAKLHEFTCIRGHQWTANLNRIRSGDGCPHCYGNVPLTLDEINQRLSIRGIILSDGFQNTMSSATFTCEKHHTWEAIVSNVLHGSGCPSCAEYGFNTEKPAEFYYARIFQTTQNPELWMIGITNRTFEERYTIKDHDKMELLYRKKFQHGKDAYVFEQTLLKNNKHLRYTSKNPLSSKGGEGAVSKELFTCDIFPYR
jgi:hypothetical protein